MLWVVQGWAQLLSSPLADANETTRSGSTVAKDKLASVPKPIGIGAVILPWTLL